MGRLSIEKGLLVAGLLASAVLWTAPPARGADVDVASIQWETNNEDAPIGDPAAVPGGIYRTWMYAYPLTFRLVGPNSNDEFSGWKRAFTLDFSLVRMHPQTDRFIPCLATAWKVMDDHKTIYFKLDPDARWSDGGKITADDYVFTNEMMRMKEIVDPFYNTYFHEHFASVEAIDEYTLKVVGTKPSWRPLYDYNLWPMPRHFHHVDQDWVKNYNLKPDPGPGPYTIKETVEGQYVLFVRQRPWWGDDKRYFKGMYNVDSIRVSVILDGDKAFDHFQKGDLSYFTVTSARRWAEDMEFDAMKKGWAHRKREFVEYPQGLYGLAMNLQRPIFQDKNFRKALQYAFDFQELNKNLMYGAYYRACSVFPGTPYANPDLVPYHFDPRKCREYLTAAGFTKRGRDGIFQRADGTRASVTLTYGQPDFTRHLTVMKQAYRKLGIEINLDPLESGTAFERTLKRDYEMAMVSYTAGFYPDPRQYFGMDYLNVADNNDIWAFGTARTDSLISIYENNMDEQKREEAMHELDRIIQDEAFYLPFWYAPFTRFCYWDDLRFPKTFWPRRYQVESDWQVFWVDPVRHQQLVAAMKANRPLGPEDTVVDVDPYGIKTRLERAYSANGAAQ